MDDHTIIQTTTGKSYDTVDDVFEKTGLQEKNYDYSFDEKAVLDNLIANDPVKFANCIVMKTK